MIPDNAWAPRLTAAAGTRLAGPYSIGTVIPASRDSSRLKAVYVPKNFILHAASLDQAFAHCRRFSTAATRRCLGRVSVPMVGVTLSRPLAVTALVSHYLTNKLIARRPLLKRIASFVLPQYRELAPVSRSYTRLKGTYLRVTTPFATLPRLSCENLGSVRLACLIHAASVRPEPGSNSH